MSLFRSWQTGYRLVLPDSARNGSTWWRHRLSRLAIPCVVIGVVVISALLVFVSGGTPQQLYAGPSNASTPEPPHGDRRLIVVVPADKPVANLCKLLFSAAALGYPSPVMVNWGHDFEAPGELIHSTHLAKIVGILDYMDGMSSDAAADGDRLSENDMIVVVDAYDVWFQLPPQVLLARYHEANRRANERLADQWQWDHPDQPMPMEQTIIVSAQKRCWPDLDSGSNLYCDKLPESPLRDDLYGSDTGHMHDSDPEGKEGERYHKVKPMYINSGSMMGPVRDMKRYFRRVKSKLEEGIMAGVALHSDQGIFGEVLGEQEIWRQLRRKNHVHGDILSDSEQAVQLAQEQFEFHVGLDYYQDMFIATVFEEDEGEIITLGNKSEIADYSKGLGIDPVRLNGVPGDMAHVPVPIDLVSKGEPASWADQPLYADFFTTAIPVALHHNAHRDDLKGRREWWWDRTWYFPYLRDLLALQLRAGEASAVAELSLGKEPLRYWRLESDNVKRAPRVYERAKLQDPLPTAEWEGLCKEEGEDPEHPWFDEIFRDGKGPFEG